MAKNNGVSPQAGPGSRASREAASASSPEASIPNAICGYPIAGWMLDSVSFDERQGQPDGWIVSLKRTRDSWRLNKRSSVVMARSDLGPLEAWDEALQIALREDAREAERASAIETQSATTAGRGPKDESATEGDAQTGGGNG